MVFHDNTGEDRKVRRIICWLLFFFVLSNHLIKLGVSGGSGPAAAGNYQQMWSGAPQRALYALNSMRVGVGDAVRSSSRICPAKAAPACETGVYWLTLVLGIY